ncbi:hypothetical protein BCV69DRAFT_33258 [Microstroma glucosiphilum]|uniref:Uncharacterized protein n=1 Tax=Pseudomicrostroma glucosiphilum TaxID=1684307 RepID=A0A316U9X8_9BASI|nr:hypothetical protein BCV69DRAFT_33258 [Pseudomicrostroma glucosiphilum]PWN19815.1 hypothetical protein BCV69DRAFT_33258 [Pseudomicrostroma glucosiphilum]
MQCSAVCPGTPCYPCLTPPLPYPPCLPSLLCPLSLILPHQTQNSTQPTQHRSSLPVSLSSCLLHSPQRDSTSRRGLAEAAKSRCGIHTHTHSLFYMSIVVTSPCAFVLLCSCARICPRSLHRRRACVRAGERAGVSSLARPASLCNANTLGPQS